VFNTERVEVVSLTILIPSNPNAL